MLQISLHAKTWNLYVDTGEKSIILIAPIILLPNPVGVGDASFPYYKQAYFDST